MADATFTMRVIAAPHMMEQFRFPRSRKKRTRSKWLRRDENWRPMRRAMVRGDTIFIHPEFLEEFKKNTEEALLREGARLDWRAV